MGVVSGASLPLPPPHSRSIFASALWPPPARAPQRKGHAHVTCLPWAEKSMAALGTPGSKSKFLFLLWAVARPQAAGGIRTHIRRGTAPVVSRTCPKPGEGPGAVGPPFPGRSWALPSSSPDPGGGCGKAVNTIKTKSTWRKWTRRKTMPNGKWPNVSRVGQSLLFSQGTAWASCCPIYGALYSGIMQQLPKTSLLLQNLGFYGITLSGWTSRQPCFVSALCEFREILTRAKTAAFYF